MPTVAALPQSFELQEHPKMNKLWNLFHTKQAYEPIRDVPQQDDEEDDIHRGSDPGAVERPFSWIEYLVFLLLGVAMLWAWNMFLAAAAYFQQRFQDDAWILNHFQAAETSISSVATLGVVLILAKLQKGASYPKRISVALLINIIAFTLLTVSTLFRAAAVGYFGFLLFAVLFASIATGLIQNGLYSFSAGFGREEYTQAIMTGQAVAGVLPALAQIVSVIAVPTKKDKNAKVVEVSSKSAFTYFLTATVISALALFAFFYLLRREARRSIIKAAATKQAANRALQRDTLRRRLSGTIDEPSDERASVPLITLFKKLPFLSTAVFLCFTVTMVFPVFSASILSVSGIDAAIFIPTAFFIWNVGDLLGRLFPLSPRLRLTHYPFALFCMAMARLLFIPLYFLCNIKGRGAIIDSDFFYLVVVQFLFGLTNGYIGSSCMMDAGEWVEPEERAATGGFMGLMLVAGLTVGSLLSFVLGDV